MKQTLAVVHGTGSQLQRQLAAYDELCQELVAAARLRFVANFYKGKNGWADMHIADVRAAQRAEFQEFQAAWEAGDEEDQVDEAGDLLNFVVFGLASARSHDRHDHQCGPPGFPGPVVEEEYDHGF